MYANTTSRRAPSLGDINGDKRAGFRLSPELANNRQFHPIGRRVLCRVKRLAA